MWVSYQHLLTKFQPQVDGDWEIFADALDEIGASIAADWARTRQRIAFFTAQKVERPVQLGPDYQEDNPPGYYLEFGHGYAAGYTANLPNPADGYFQQGTWPTGAGEASGWHHAYLVSSGPHQRISRIHPVGGGEASGQGSCYVEVAEASQVRYSLNGYAHGEADGSGYSYGADEDPRWVLYARGDTHHVVFTENNITGVEYVPSQGEFVLVRTDRNGVWVGYWDSGAGMCGRLTQARLIVEYSESIPCGELANNLPQDVVQKIALVQPWHELKDIIAILPMQNAEAWLQYPTTKV